jgi:hypothetical protein
MSGPTVAIKEAECKHVVASKKRWASMRKYADDDPRWNKKSPWPRGALKITALQRGRVYKMYNIDNVSPWHGALVYDEGVIKNEHLLRYMPKNQMDIRLYKYKGQWVSGSGADICAFFEPYGLK